MSAVVNAASFAAVRARAPVAEPRRKVFSGARVVVKANTTRRAASSTTVAMAAS